MEQTSRNIDQIEGELTQLLQADKANWVRIYELMDEVDRGRLWGQHARSFTAWVRGLAGRIGIHESLLWSRKKAGGIYAEYARRAAERGAAAAPMAELDISPDSLVFCDKIARGSDTIRDELIEKTLAGELKRVDLQQAWKARRAEIESKGVKPTRPNAHTELEPEPESEPAAATERPAPETPAAARHPLTAADVVLALNRPEWLDAWQHEMAPNVTHSPYKKMVYRGFPEFPVQTGTTRNARRIDLLVVENHTVKTTDFVILHGVEIKVSRSDLLKDQKCSEYAPYVDLMWIAVPEVLLEDAERVAEPNWGIITIDKNRKATVAKGAAVNAPLTPMREHTLATALIKLL